MASPGAERKLLLLERFADLVDGVVTFAELHGPVTRGGLAGLAVWSRTRRDEEDRFFLSTKVVAHDLEGARGVPEGTRDLCGGAIFDEERTQRIVLTLLRGGRVREETLARTYAFWCADRHNCTLVHARICVKTQKASLRSDAQEG
jgi:hypothetical protein